MGCYEYSRSLSLVGRFEGTNKSICGWAVGATDVKQRCGDAAEGHLHTFGAGGGENGVVAGSSQGCEI